MKRLYNHKDLEYQALQSFYSKDHIEAGIDEAGRGCLAGPVVAAAVILPKSFKHSRLTDSKKLSKKLRHELREEIQDVALAWSIQLASNLEIDKINILNATYLAMHRAIKKLSFTPGLLLIDGNRFKSFPGIPHVCIIKGDQKYYSIAAASVLAKTYRDDLMETLHKAHPEYYWIRNKGYPTKQHRSAIVKAGITKYHRQSFQLLDRQNKLDI